VFYAELYTMYLSKEKRNIGESFFEFNKLPLRTKLDMLFESAFFVDEDRENDRVIQLFFLKGFFVEKVVCINTGAVIEVIPFKNGYRIYQFLN